MTDDHVYWQRYGKTTKYLSALGLFLLLLSSLGRSPDQVRNSLAGLGLKKLECAYRLIASRKRQTKHVLDCRSMTDGVAAPLGSTDKDRAIRRGRAWFPIPVINTDRWLASC
jgi:hypothetical protein